MFLQKISGIACVALFLSWQTSFAQNLDRKPLLGIAYEAVKQAEGANLPEGLRIKDIIPNSSAEKAGLLKGDLIIQFNSQLIDSKSNLAQLTGGKKTGEVIQINILRSGKKITKKVVLTEFPREENPAFTTVYDQVVSGENIIRSFVTKPSTMKEKYPAVFIIQGIGCGRIENPLKNEDAVYSLVDSLTRAGLVTMRMERTGVGNSKGIPCNSVDFPTDLANFKEGLKKLKSYAYVDPERVYLVGLSMGGIMAPILSSEIEVRGIVVYGTGGKDWFSYELENTLRQSLLEGVPIEKLHNTMQREQRRLHHFLTEKKSPDEIKKIDLEMGKKCEDYPLHWSYFQGVSEVDIYKAWAHCPSKVLALHGHSDYISAALEHELIADIVNQSHPGNAEYFEIPSADHWFQKTNSEKESFERRSEGINYEAIQYIKNWIVKH
jgi:uncharacterized protein